MCDASKPWVSFCIATFNRVAILANTLNTIKEQTFTDFEVIISDNDPDQSGRQVVEGMHDKRFRYFCNAENVGMVNNFNIALGYARGDFVVMHADDDPPVNDFLFTMHELWKKYPNYGAYYGACEVYIENEAAAETYQTKIGKIGFLANAPANEIRCFSSEIFPFAFFERRVFPYTLWSTGIVRRDIALHIGGMPNYGSPLLTDFTYVALACAYSGCVTINKILGGQALHGGNSGFADPHNIEIALTGCYRYLSDKLSQREDWGRLRTYVEKFLSAYIVSHCIAMERYFVRIGNTNELTKLKETMERLYALPYMSRGRQQYRRTHAIIFVKRFVPSVIYKHPLVRRLCFWRG